MNRLQSVKCFVLDMDGTIYLGNELFPFTLDFLRKVEQSGRRFVFFTNNSSRSYEAYRAKLNRMGIPVTREQMLISTDVILEYIHSHYPGKSAYVVGTESLVEAFRQAGVTVCEDADLCVLGFDTELTYHKLVVGCDLVRHGKPFLAVNQDWNCPVEGGGFIPDCGSMARLFAASTGVEPIFFGKPTRRALDYMLKATGCRPEELAVVGDRLYTDIAVAAGSGVTSVLVLSGEATRADLKDSPVQPDLVVQDLSELATLL